MNYQKLDAPLSMALNDAQNKEEPSLQVFIHTQPVIDSAKTTVLENLGVNVTGGNDVFTATLSPSAISQLSDQPWVQSVKLSQKLQLLNKQKVMGGVRLL